MRPATRHLRCPFPPCTAEWWFGDLGQDVVPLHAPKTAPAWTSGAACPGSLMTYQPDSDVLAPPDTAKIQRAYAAYLALAGEPLPSAYLGAPVGRPADQPEEYYFPGRPADAPEPGPGDPHPAVEIGAGHHLGKAEMENSHSTTKGLAMLAVNQMGLTQDLLARMTAAVDEAEAVAIAAESQIRSVQGLVSACVGTGADAPTSGERMAEQTSLAADTIGGENNIGNALALAKQRIADAHRQIAVAAEEGRRYIGQLS